jgi:hypothetical protein
MIRSPDWHVIQPARRVLEAVFVYGKPNTK